MSVGRFKAAHRGDLDLLIDPEHPDLGPKNNQFVFLAGRIEHGRKEFSQRIIKDAMGSENWFEHTTVCEQSHHIAYKNFTGRYKDGKWHNGKEHMKPDVPNCEFVLFFGTSPFEANFGPTNWASYLTNAQARNGFKFAVARPPPEPYRRQGQLLAAGETGSRRGPGPGDDALDHRQQALQRAVSTSRQS